MGGGGKLEKVLNVILTTAAVAIAVVVIRREFAVDRRPTSRFSQRDSKPEFYSDWRALRSSGIELGNSKAPIQIIEFVDLECPVCRYFHKGPLKDARTRFGDSIALTVIHMPLRNHRFASIAARASECAGEQGRFGPFIDAVLDKQDSLGFKSWVSYGSDAGVPDTSRLSACVSSGASVARIDSGVAVAARVGISATPTVFLNGWRFAIPPTSEQLTNAIESLLAGREPFP